MRVPEACRDALREYVAPEGYTVAPKTKLSSSVIYSWGVRIQRTVNDKIQFKWVCLATDQCRQTQKKYLMSHGKTSKPTLHLKTHGITSTKTVTTFVNKSRLESQIDRLKMSKLYRDDPQRFTVLIETMRVIVNNLPYKSVDYEHSKLLRALCYKNEFQAVLNTKVVDRTIYELYMCGKKEITGVIEDSRLPFGSFSLVTDFWTSKVQNTKYVGVRLYFVDAKFKFRSILLGTRPFNPQYGDRDAGIREPYQRWIVEILRGFGVKPSDLFGSTSDGGPDVKWMMRNGFNLRWEWCIPHLSNAATKAACGLVEDVTKSKNPGLTDLLKLIVRTVYQTKHVEVMGTLFEELCGMLSSDNSTQLLDYRSHRFLGLTRVIERILLKWDPLEEWYEARQKKAREERKAEPAFPLKGYKTILTQFLSLLMPISTTNTLAQAESAGQVEVLLSLFRLRLYTLNPAVKLRDHRSLPYPARPEYFRVEELHPLIATTRNLLRDTFYTNYFKRYVDERTMRQSSFVFEMQLALHPDYKKLDGSLLPVVMLVNEQHRDDCQSGEEEEKEEDGGQEAFRFKFVMLCALIKEKIRELMFNCVPRAEQVAQVTREMSENRRLFGGGRSASDTISEEIRARAVLDELTLWFNDQTSLQDNNGELESVLSYWGRQQQIGRYRTLPLVARALFSVPSSSAQLERDFGVSGMHVSALRARIRTENVDMCAFINRNREYVDITQCAAIPDDANDSADMHFNVMDDFDDSYNLGPVFSN